MRSSAKERGTVLVIVLWISLGITGMALYFAHTMVLHYRASENMLAGNEALQTIESAQRYLRLVLSEEERGTVPDETSLPQEDVSVGEGAFWLIGRGEEGRHGESLTFGVIDEASKLNLNTATLEMLETLPGMTPEVAAAIKDWRDDDKEVSPDGAESETYLMLDTPYFCKDGRFETVDELRLINGMDLEILYGEDLNRNGMLDPNEDDAEETEPPDNRDGSLDFGLSEFLTVYSREPNTTAEGEERINLNEADEKELTALISEKFGEQRAKELQQQLGQTRGNYSCVLELYYRIWLTMEEFEEIADYLTVHEGDFIEGLVNVTTAPKEVLACVPGIGEEYAKSLVSYREGKDDELKSVVWVTEVMDDTSVLEAGPYLTAKSYQFCADVAAVGTDGRGFRRTRFVIDTSGDEPVVVFRRDLSGLGWALGSSVREELSSVEEGPGQ